MVSNLHDEEHNVLRAEVENQKSPESPSFPSRYIYTVRPVQRVEIRRAAVGGTVG